jgi:hypothetical protein
MASDNGGARWRRRGGGMAAAKKKLSLAAAAYRRITAWRRRRRSAWHLGAAMASAQALSASNGATQAHRRRHPRKASNWKNGAKISWRGESKAK